MALAARCITMCSKHCTSCGLQVLAFIEQGAHPLTSCASYATAIRCTWPPGCDGLCLEACWWLHTLATVAYLPAKCVTIEPAE